MQETWFWSLGWKDPLEKEMATNSSTLAWKIPWTDEPGRLPLLWHYKKWYILKFCAQDMLPNKCQDIKNRWQEYTEELYKKDLHDQDNHHGVITHLKPDILECEVKWALESITTNKASGGDGIPVELFKSWKMMLWKCCTQHASKSGKLSSGHRPGKGQFSFQSQRKAMPKNDQTTTQLHSSHTLAK